MPDISHLRVFGSKWTVLTPKHSCSFLGYDGNGPNYRVLVDSKIEFICREHAKFFENSVDSSKVPNDPHSGIPESASLVAVPDLSMPDPAAVAAHLGNGEVVVRADDAGTVGSDSAGADPKRD
jgi:hypothetical protein